MLGLGALFVSISSQYAEETYALLFGEVFGISQGEVLPILLPRDRRPWSRSGWRSAR